MTREQSYDAAIGLGTNMGDKRGNIRRALELLTADGAVRLVRRSRDYRSAPWGKTDQDWFVNACALVATTLSAHELLKSCQAVENAMGRVREQHWGPRIIDVDVLTYRGQTIDTPDLKVPHPYIEERAFVVLPLDELAPGEVIRGRTVRDLAEDIDAADVTPL